VTLYTFTGGARMVTGLARTILFGLTPTDPRVFVIDPDVSPSAHSAVVG